MSLKLSTEESKTIALARKHEKIQIWTMFIIFVVVIVGYFASMDGIIEWRTYSLITFTITISLTSNILLKVYPLQDKLLTLVERNIHGSGEAI